LTFSQPLPSGASAAELFAQDPRRAAPQIQLNGMCATAAGLVHANWIAKPDLLGSRHNDCHFLVEMDNDGHAHLRFGDDDLGHRPEAGTIFTAMYRTGNGLAGNVGAEAISYFVLRRGRLSGAILKPRNPMPAEGGVEPQPLAEVKLLRPPLFASVWKGRSPRLIMRNSPSAIRKYSAAAIFRWTGSWYEVLVAIDPLGLVEAGQELLDEIAQSLFRFRRMGHDVVVKRAQYVALDIAMNVCVKPGYTRGHIKAALLDVFSDEVLPDGRLGFFHPDHLTFGQGIRLSQLIVAAQAVIGVESVQVTKLERLYKGPNQELKNGILPLSVLEIARLDNDPSFPENGRLTFDIRVGDERTQLL
jgi:predicted phage baseplate assembly protein